MDWGETGRRSISIILKSRSAGSNGCALQLLGVLVFSLWMRVCIISLTSKLIVAVVRVAQKGLPSVA